MTGWKDNWSPYDELYGNTNTESYDTSYSEDEDGEYDAEEV